MRRNATRNVVIPGAILAASCAVAILGVAGQLDLAVASLGILVGVIGVGVTLSLSTAVAAMRSERSASTAEAIRAKSDASHLRDELAATREELAALAKREAEGMALIRRLVVKEIGGVRSEVEETRSATASVARQIRRLEPDLITEVQALEQLLVRYTPVAPLPLAAGWALSPSGLMYITDAIERHGAEFVVECGSGTSTLWMAMAMRHRGSGKVLALEHDAGFAEQTRANLELHGLSNWAEVRVSPLTSVATTRGMFQWYDVDVDALDRRIDILLVDGPPGIIGRHARYPAVPRLLPKLAEQTMIIVDDAHRPEEREVIDFWIEEFPGLQPGTSPGRGVQVLEFARSPRT